MARWWVLAHAATWKRKRVWWGMTSSVLAGNSPVVFDTQVWPWRKASSMEVLVTAPGGEFSGRMVRRASTGVT